MKRLATAALIAGAVLTTSVSTASAATLIDVAGQNYSFDADNSLNWLDLNETLGLSYFDIVGGAGGFLDAGWRYASSSEVGSMLAINLPSFTTTSPTGADNYTASPQVDANGEAAALISILGDTDVGVSLAAFGIFDRSATCAGGCTAHSYGGLELILDPTSPIFGLASAGTTGAIQDSARSPTIGSFLVRDVAPSPVPNPSALPLLMSALGLFGFFGWRRKKTAAA